MNDAAYAIGILAALALVLVVWVIASRNRIIRMMNAIDNAYAQVDVLLKRRADLIPNLVEVVKGYAAHERGVFESVSAARAGLLAAKGVRETDEANGILSQTIGRLFAVAEAYPQLKADANFGRLQAELVDTENRLSFGRQSYNETVLDYNNVVTTFPGSAFASSLGASKRPMLSIADSDRALPKVSFAPPASSG